MIDIILKTFFTKTELCRSIDKNCKRFKKTYRDNSHLDFQNAEERTVLSRYFEHVKGLLT
jgi:hypothetical protein